MFCRQSTVCVRRPVLCRTRFIPPTRRLVAVHASVPPLKTLTLTFPDSSEDTVALHSEKSMRRYLSNKGLVNAVFHHAGVNGADALTVVDFDDLEDGGHYEVVPATKPRALFRKSIKLVVPGLDGCLQTLYYARLEQQQLDAMFDVCGAASCYLSTDTQKSGVRRISDMQPNSTYVLHIPWEQQNLRGFVTTSAAAAAKKELAHWLEDRALADLPGCTLKHVQTDPFKDDTTNRDLVQLDMAYVAKALGAVGGVLYICETKSAVTTDDVLEAKRKVEKVRDALPNSSKLRSVLSGVSKARVYVGGSGVAATSRRENVHQMASLAGIGLVLPTGVMFNDELVLQLDSKEHTL